MEAHFIPSSEQNHTLFISVSSDASRFGHVRGRERKIAPCAYSGLSVRMNDGRVFWGRGYVSDNQSYFAQCIIHYLDELTLATDDNFTLDVCLENDGAREYLEKFAWKWKANDDRNAQGKVPNNFKTWERALNLSLLGKLTFRKPDNIDEKAKLAETRRTARQRAKELGNFSFDTPEGLVERGH